MNDLEDEPYFSGNLYVSHKFDMNKVSGDFVPKYAKNVDLQKRSGFGRILQTGIANVIYYSLEPFRSLTLHFWKGL